MHKAHSQILVMSKYIFSTLLKAKEQENDGALPGMAEINIKRSHGERRPTVPSEGFSSTTKRMIC